MNPTTVSVSPERREIVVTRLFNAPRELVFALLTQPEHIMRWWGCHEMTMTMCEVDLRVGGAYRYVGRMPDGGECSFHGVYREIVPPARLVHTQIIAIEHQPSVEAVVTVTFDEVNGKTGLTSRLVFATEAAFQGAAAIGVQHGMADSIDQLGVMVEAMQTSNESDFVIARTFDAPREMVFRAWSESERLAKWWGPKGFTVEVARMEFVSGGTFLYSLRSASGQEMWGKFVYEEIDAPERIVFATSFSNAAGETVRAPFSAEFPREIRNVVTFAEHDGKTELTLRGGPLHATETERAFFQSMFTNMEQGFGGTFDQLAGYLADSKGIYS